MHTPADRAGLVGAIPQFSPLSLSHARPVKSKRARGRQFANFVLLVGARPRTRATWSDQARAPVLACARPCRNQGAGAAAMLHLHCRCIADNIGNGCAVVLPCAGATPCATAAHQLVRLMAAGISDSSHHFLAFVPRGIACWCSAGSSALATERVLRLDACGLPLGEPDGLSGWLALCANEQMIAPTWCVLPRVASDTCGESCEKRPCSAQARTLTASPLRRSGAIGTSLPPAPSLAGAIGTSLPPARFFQRLKKLFAPEPTKTARKLKFLGYNLRKKSRGDAPAPRDQWSLRRLPKGGKGR